MRMIDRSQAYERQAYRSSGRRKPTGCRVYLRVSLHEFLVAAFHRPAGCPHWHYVLNIGKRP